MRSTRIIIAGLSAVFLLLSPIPAQDGAGGTGEPESKSPQEKKDAPPLSQDPKALEAFSAMLDKVYKPRTSGLQAITAEIRLTQSIGPRKTELGPFRLQWTKGKGYSLRDTEGKAVPQLPEKSSRAFQIVHDLVGYDPRKQLGEYGFEVSKEGAVKAITPPDTPDPSRFILFVPDKKGRIGLQRVMGKNGKPLLERTFTYAAFGKTWVVESSRTRAPGITYITRYERALDGSGFQFPKEIRTITPKGEILVTYTVIETTPEKARGSKD